MSAHVILILLNKLGKRDKMRKTRAQILDTVYHMTLQLL